VGRVLLTILSSILGPAERVARCLGAETVFVETLDAAVDGVGNDGELGIWIEDVLWAERGVMG
jgi:hypothetical protein